MPKNSFISRFLIFVIPLFFLVMADQLTKFLAVEYLKDGSSVALILDIVYFLYVENAGVAFGLFSGHRYIFSLIACLVSILLFIYAMRMPMDRKFLPLRICLSCITAGALGNVIDRLRLGYVIDFIYFKPIDFPVFNFADICVTVSTALVIFLFVFVYNQDDIEKLELKKSGEIKLDE